VGGKASEAVIFYNHSVEACVPTDESTDAAWSASSKVTKWRLPTTSVAGYLSNTTVEAEGCSTMPGALPNGVTADMGTSVSGRVTWRFGRPGTEAEGGLRGHLWWAARGSNPAPWD